MLYGIQMNEQEPHPKVERGFIADALQLQENLNIFRSRITTKLDAHGALNSRGIGLALFERRIEHEDEPRPSVYQAMIYQFRTTDKSDNLAYDKPIIKLLVNDGILTPRGVRYVVTDITVDHEDDVQAMIDVFENEYPDFPEEDTFLSTSKPQARGNTEPYEPQGILFDVREDDIVFSDNFRYNTTQVGIDPKTFGYDQDVIFPFGDYHLLSDRIDGARMANEVLDTIANTEPYFIKV